MNIKKSLFDRGGALLAAAAFLAGVAAPLVLPAAAYASGQFSPRKLTMSSQAAGNVSTDANGNAVAAGAGGNGAKANHTFAFTMGTSGATVQSIVLQYCTTPLLGTTCTAPAGLDTSTVASVASNSGFGGTAPTLDTTTNATTGGLFTSVPCSGSGNARQNCILVQRSGASAFAGTPALTLGFGQGAGTDWIKNPTASGAFFVRITAFSDTSYTTVVDEAAVAGSVNTNIDITAKVQEKLNFSVAAAYSVPGASCTALSGSGAVALGDSNGVLDMTTAYDAHSYFRLSTNASNGTSVLYSGDTLKTLSGNSIAAIGGTFALSNPGSEQFGLGLDSGDTNQSLTNLTAAANYAAANGNINAPSIAAKFAYDTASVTSPVQLASAAGGTTVSCDTGSVRYVGNIATTTKAGIYKTTVSYIAVPNF